MFLNKNWFINIICTEKRLYSRMGLEVVLCVIVSGCFVFNHSEGEQGLFVILVGYTRKTTLHQQLEIEIF